MLSGQIKMASQEQSVREFVAVTGVDEERARFFLESAGWSLHVSPLSWFLAVLNWSVGRGSAEIKSGVVALRSFSLRLMLAAISQ